MCDFLANILQKQFRWTAFKLHASSDTYIIGFSFSIYRCCTINYTKMSSPHPLSAKAAAKKIEFQKTFESNNKPKLMPSPIPWAGGRPTHTGSELPGTSYHLPFTIYHLTFTSYLLAVYIYLNCPAILKQQCTMCS